MQIISSRYVPVPVYYRKSNFPVWLVVFRSCRLSTMCNYWVSEMLTCICTCDVTPDRLTDRSNLVNINLKTGKVWVVLALLCISYSGTTQVSILFVLTIFQDSKFLQQSHFSLSSISHQVHHRYLSTQVIGLLNICSISNFFFLVHSLNNSPRITHSVFCVLP